MLQGCRRDPRPAGLRLLPPQLPGEAVDHQGQREPAVTPAAEPAQARLPALVRGRGRRRQGLDPRSHAHDPFAHLSTHSPEDALHRVLVHAQQDGHRAVAKGRLHFDQLIDGGQLRRRLGCGLHCPVVHRAPRHIEPPDSLVMDTATPSALSACWIVTIRSHPCPTETPIISRTQLQHRFPVGFLQVLELTLVLLAHVFGLGAQRVLPYPLAVLDPVLDLRRRQFELPARLRHARLTLDDLQHQRRFPPCRPAFDLFFHHDTYGVSV